MLTKLARTHILSQSFLLFPLKKKHIGYTMLWEAPKWDHMVLQSGHVGLFQLAIRQNPLLLVGRNLASDVDDD